MCRSVTYYDTVKLNRYIQCVYTTFIYYNLNANSSEFVGCFETRFHPQFEAYFTVRMYSVENAT